MCITEVHRHYSYDPTEMKTNPPVGTLFCYISNHCKHDFSICVSRLHSPIKDTKLINELAGHLAFLVRECGMCNKLFST